MIRVPVLMYMREPADEAPRAGLDTFEAFVLAVCAVGVVYLGLFPNGAVGDLNVLDWTRQSVAALLDGASTAAR